LSFLLQRIAEKVPKSDLSVRVKHCATGEGVGRLVMPRLLSPIPRVARRTPLRHVRHALHLLCHRHRPPHRQSRYRVLGQIPRLRRPAGLAPVPRVHTPDARRRPTLSRTQGSRPSCSSTSSRHHVVQPRRSGAVLPVAPASGLPSSVRATRNLNAKRLRLLHSPYPAQLGHLRVFIHPWTPAVGPVPCTATCFADTHGTSGP